MRALLVLVLGVAAGCGGNDSVWSSAVTKMVLNRSGGGFAPPLPPSAECPTQGVEYTLVVADRSLSAWVCAPGATAPYTLMRVSAARTLSAVEFDALVPTLEAMRVVRVDTCGADKPAWTLSVTTPSGTTEYQDSFYGCIYKDQPTVDSDALDAAGAALGQLAFPQR